jgi:small subunit ribosomal protein S21
MAEPIGLQIESQVRMQVSVRDNNVDQALRVLKRAREHAAAVSRARKADRKRAEKDQ